MIRIDDDPRQQQRAEVLRVGQVHPPDPPAARREQLALLDEVRGEEHDEQHLRRLAGLHGERAEPDPEPGAVELDADARRERQQQRDDAEQQERVAVAGERADVAHDDERRDERGDADRGPQRLRRCDPLALGHREVEPGDRDEADAEQRARRVGAGSRRRAAPTADREVRDHEQAEDRARGSPRARAGASGASDSASST